jgi:Zn-dependent protease
MEQTVIGVPHMHVVRWLFPFTQGLGLGIIAMLLHECGHLVAAICVGVRIKNVGMKWNKGLYTIREKGTPLQNLIVAAAGPFANILLCSTAPWAHMFALANFCYAIANTLPIEGSDGYRIASCWLQLRLPQSSSTQT